jgi:hypothetical protein
MRQTNRHGSDNRCRLLFRARLVTLKINEILQNNINHDSINELIDTDIK